MVVCFNCSPPTKRTLDNLVAQGHYRDYGEAISLAVDNLAVLQEQLGTAAAVVIEPKHGRPGSRGSQAAPPAQAMPLTTQPAEQDPRRREPYVPDLFRLPEPSTATCEAHLPLSQFAPGEPVVLERWIFGQYNRLLPAKASCRALANLLPEQPNGVDLETAGRVIAKCACELGDSLAAHERRYGIHPDEALSTAFPSTGKGEKSLLRFRTQFVATTTKAGELLGLLADLRLIGYVGESTHTIALTSGGWRYALARNPVLEGEQETPTQKLSHVEQDLLLAHVAAEVPVEDSAYRAILAAVRAGATRPAELDEALAAALSPEARSRVTNSFVSTQRSGAISRMSDLGLIARVRDGVKVSYLATPKGLSYSSAQVPGPV